MNREAAIVSKSADEVVEGVFAKAVAEPDLKKMAAALRDIWEDDNWTDVSIDRAIERLREER
jgi:hypothetical protein